ncbi:SNAP25 homologous protein SNAP33-like [Phragmites australis]|uniref:SNAP25 homologous protein SNAP33-like n=1 Tax=Phragmites australis TaxID=29695 RepID=UPI002D77AC52|nr:SNAP25 homologous protein SNAP33-like [Phragmites australis]
MPVPRGAKPAASSKGNPFDSDSDSEFTSKPGKKSSSSSYSAPADAKKRYKDGFRDTGGLENQSVQELEHYAAYKAEETTDALKGCLRIAEDIKEDATNTLITLHKQGQQISRTHEKAVDIDQDLTKSESLLGSLGGFFSKPWKPKKTRQIKGPALVSRDDSFKKKASRMEQRDKLGLSPRGKSSNRHYAEATDAMDKVQVEKQKQDDALDDLSGVLGQLKGMAVDMGSELDRQNEALDHLQDDVDELNSRVKGANQRARKLVGK